MADDITPGEVERALAQFRDQVREDLRDLATRIEGAALRSVSADVYRADQRLAEERFRVMRADLDRMDKDHQAERDAARSWRDRRDAFRKWFLASLILPIGGLVVEIIFELRGGK